MAAAAAAAGGGADKPEQTERNEKDKRSETAKGDKNAIWATTSKLYRQTHLLTECYADQESFSAKRLSS